jgi:hypothetical protein
MCGAPERLPVCAYLVNHNNNGSQSTVVETVEQTGVVCHEAEPMKFVTPPSEQIGTSDDKYRTLSSNL